MKKSGSIVLCRTDWGKSSKNWINDLNKRRYARLPCRSINFFNKELCLALCVVLMLFCYSLALVIMNHEILELLRK